MISLSEVKNKGARKNGVQNNKLHFFSSKFSIYFSWAFINLGLNANQVTGVFFVTGLIGAFAFTGTGNAYAILGYALWRLHIIFDLCDGDVARFNQKFSINGAYWDYMIHSVLYPLTFVCITVSLFNKYDDPQFLLIGAFGGIVASQLLAVKNNYYRAMLFQGQPLNLLAGKKSPAKGISIKDLILYLVSFDGFLFFYLIFCFTVASSFMFVLLLLSYLSLFLCVVMAKLIMFSRDGFYERRS